MTPEEYQPQFRHFDSFEDLARAHAAAKERLSKAERRVQELASQPVEPLQTGEIARVPVEVLEADHELLQAQGDFELLDGQYQAQLQGQSEEREL
ncbi:hypothetical protein [Streptomyces sp. BPTC-684]|uniref:hypothetical protein n=1 Tax=Streptomyces sp. BPTC-684 TaxID=3043734 RepID=UPI0024B05270|nr:hypothetical protein [Streptomyces sp. BPTC-684]WHM36313.1 hypothetical protein QIY60_04785 [Streptomyces sp. BPTC-684]